jgi:hypothetical protein
VIRLSLDLWQIHVRASPQDGDVPSFDDHVHVATVGTTAEVHRAQLYLIGSSKVILCNAQRMVFAIQICGKLERDTLGDIYSKLQQNCVFFALLSR